MLADAVNGGDTLETGVETGVSNIVFAFLNGESFDYIGSSGLVYDMENENFPYFTNSAEEVETSDQNDTSNAPGSTSKEEQSKLLWPKINLPSLKFVLELGQLGKSSKESDTLFAHVDTKFDQEDLLKSLVNSSKVIIKEPTASVKSQGLPPASLQSFLKSRRDVPGILLTNFEQQYTNKYFHGPYDNFTLLNVYNYSEGDNQDVVNHLSEGMHIVHALLLPHCMTS